MVQRYTDLILKHGLEQARQMAETKADRQCIEITAAMLADERGEIGISHSGFALTSLPHRAIKEPLWIKEGYKITLHVESGRDENGAYRGVPYGAKARMILLYLQTEALRNRSPDIELGRSMRAWMTRMGLQTGGETYRRITEQSRRISACRLTFFRDIGTPEKARHNGAFVENEIPMYGLRRNDGQMSLWQDTVTLNKRFYDSLIEHAVPLRDEAIRQLNNKSLALDVYTWLAYRLHSLHKPMSVSWPAIFAQFGAGYSHLRQFKPKFREALGYALAAYPEAHITVHDAGLTLHRSLPPVNRRVYALT